MGLKFLQVRKENKSEISVEDYKDNHLKQMLMKKREIKAKRKLSKELGISNGENPVTKTSNKYKGKNGRNKKNRKKRNNKSKKLDLNKNKNENSN